VAIAIVKKDQISQSSWRYDVLAFPFGGPIMSPEKLRMNDLVVILPGITGSVLTRNGTPIWAPAPTTLLNWVRSHGHSLRWLRIEREDDPDYDDGVEATALVPYTFAPGLYRFDGYTGMTRHLSGHFQLVMGNARITDGPPANYFEFPYDWRKDNAIAAGQLKQLIDRELPRWRHYVDDPDACVIFIAHSMGGLVARYYIEVLKGYPLTRALITFGTPHRGSPQAFDYLVNGYRKLGVELRELTAILQSLPSVYQLLPRYRAVLDVDGVWKRVFETTHDIKEIDRARAKKAYVLYDAIEAAHAVNRKDNRYAVEMLPVVGWGHDTKQSLRIHRGGRLEVGDDRPPDVDPVFANGDGTVPRVSAVPLELNAKPLRWWMINQKHAMMQNGQEMLANLAQVVGALQGDLRQPARALGSSPTNGFGLDIDDVFEAGEPVTIRVTLHGTEDPNEITARIEPAHITDGSARDVVLVPTGFVWSGEVTGLPAGRYRVSIQSKNAAAGPTDLVADVFEVM
jgi:pimeloyl-ACP methyl ester carboxylesterase